MRNAKVPSSVYTEKTMFTEAIHDENENENENRKWGGLLG